MAVRVGWKQVNRGHVPCARPAWGRPFAGIRGEVMARSAWWLRGGQGTSAAAGGVVMRAAAPRTTLQMGSHLGGLEEGCRVLGVKVQLERLLTAALTESFPQKQWVRALLVPTADPKFGDYQCNNAMPLFAKLKGADFAPKNPRQVAEKIVASIPENEMIEQVSIAGPGFINFKLSGSFVAEHAASLLDDERGGVDRWAPLPACRRAAVDFSSPNVAKEMHVGHLRSTIIGDAISRVLEYTGVNVLRLNHIGDWGTQFGMLIQFMDERNLPFDAPVSDLQELYKQAKVCFDADTAFKRRAQAAVVALQGGDARSLARWGTICDASRKEFDEIYKRLGVDLEERGESFYNTSLPGLVADLEASGVAEHSEGATCVFVEGSEVPLIIKKSDGGFGYATTDMAALKQRLEEERADWIIYVTDSGQTQHFRAVFAAAEKCGWVGSGDGSGAACFPRVDHVGFGLVLGEDGKRLRTRSGDAVRLADLLDEAVARCEQQIIERGSSYASDAGVVRQTAEQMGYSAVKYADLKQNRQTDYEFSFDRMTDLKGNTAVYLQYAHARVCSIMAKAEGRQGGGPLSVEDPTERALLLEVCRFPEAVESAVEDLAPNRLCEYLYNLTGKFTDFYGSCKVIGSEQETTRLAICRVTLVVMRKCFALLGMEPIDRI